MPLRIGETFAEYRIVRLLGAGGMGEVYLVQHPRLPRHDALKVLRPDISSDSSFQERFIREADLAAALRHPNIIALHDRGEDDGQLWIAMDYIDGTDAAQLLQRRYPAGMPIDLVVQIVTAVASALDYAHKKGLLHRDVKPANIIVADLDTDDQEVFLADFGIARSLEDISGITTTNMTVGTVAYAAPEQLMGEQMDGRADQYALAATTYHLLTGHQPFPHSNPAVVISRHLNSMPPKVGDRRPDLAGVDDVLQSALSKEPDGRYPSCITFAHALTGDAFGRIGASPTANTQEAPRTHKPAPMASPALGTARNAWATPSRFTWVALFSATAILLTGALALAWRPWDLEQSSVTTTTPASITTPGPPTTSSPAPAAAPPTSATPPTTRVGPPPAPTPAPELIPTVTTTTEASGLSAAESDFVTVVADLPTYVKPGRINEPAKVVAGGYRACQAMDNHPNDSQAAVQEYYPRGTQADGTVDYNGMLFFIYSANYLCPRHSGMWENF